MSLFSQKKIGLALGAGGGKGWAHIGILKVLNREKINLHAISGTSAGALVAAFYAAGRLYKFEEILLEMNSWKKSLKYFDLVYPKSGLIKGERISELIDHVLGDIDFPQLRIPLAIVAVDVLTGREIVFREKDLKIGLRASLSLPGVMSPVKYNGMLLVDGGLLNPLPVMPVRELGAEKVIAVDLSGLMIERQGKKYLKKTIGYIYNERPFKKKSIVSEATTEGLFQTQASKAVIQLTQATNNDKKLDLGVYDILMRTFSITQNRMFYLEMKDSKPDLVLSPKLHYKLLEFYRAVEAIEEGERVAYQYLKQIKKLSTSPF